MRADVVFNQNNEMKTNVFFQWFRILIILLSKMSIFENDSLMKSKLIMKEYDI